MLVFRLANFVLKTLSCILISIGRHLVLRFFFLKEKKKNKICCKQFELPIKEAVSSQTEPAVPSEVFELKTLQFR